MRGSAGALLDGAPKVCFTAAAENPSDPLLRRFLLSAKVPMSEFVFREIVPLGEDDTPYRKLRAISSRPPPSRRAHRQGAAER